MTSPTDTSVSPDKAALPAESGQPASAGLAAIGAQVLQLFEQLSLTRVAPTPERADGGLEQVLKRLESIEEGVSALREAPNVEEESDTFVEPPPMVEPLASVLMGDALRADKTLTPVWEQLTSQVLVGESTACQLGAFLMLFHRGALEECHKWIQAIGESWYRWAGEENGEAKQALINWLNQECVRRNVPLRVEEVRSGVRFDSDRHIAVGQPGRDVYGVQGWLVLREDKSIFSKALVDSR